MSSAPPRTSHSATRNWTRGQAVPLCTRCLAEPVASARQFVVFHADARQSIAMQDEIERPIATPAPAHTHTHTRAWRGAGRRGVPIDRAGPRHYRRSRNALARGSGSRSRRRARRANPSTARGPPPHSGEDPNLPRNEEGPPAWAVEEWAQAEPTFLLAPSRHLGMGHGPAAAIAAAPLAWSGALVCLADIPFITADLLRRLAAAPTAPLGRGLLPRGPRRQPRRVGPRLAPAPFGAYRRYRRERCSPKPRQAISGGSRGPCRLRYARHVCGLARGPTPR